MPIGKIQPGVNPLVQRPLDSDVSNGPNPVSSGVETRREKPELGAPPPRPKVQISAQEIREVIEANAIPPAPEPRDDGRIAIGGGWLASQVESVRFTEQTGETSSTGFGFALEDPTGLQTFVVKDEFATAYLQKFDETAGHDAAWFLGPPLENQREEKVWGVDEPRTVQRFERGTLTWTPSQGVQLLPNRAAPTELRFRFAPSPTGHLHIGGAYVALKNFMAAKLAGGKFFLRIEDTDTVRSRPEYTKAIKEGLEWLGITYENDVVHQSARTEAYNQKIDKLLAEGKAYVGEGGAVFFRMPQEGRIVVNDMLRGRVAIQGGQAGMNDFVIRRSDGAPAFLLANVVDDGDQGITHVIRGVDHLTNAAKQVKLFEAMGYRTPEFYHIPLIHGDDGAKLSKRHGATSVIDFQREGFAPEVMVNHLARLGFGYSTPETIPLNELIAEFNPDRIGKSKSQIGYDALHARNREYISKMSVESLTSELTTRAEQIEVQFDDGAVMTFAGILGPAGLESLAVAAQGRASTFQEAIELGMLTLAPPDVLESDVERFSRPALQQVLREARSELEKVPPEAWNRQTFASIPRNIADQEGRMAFRWAVTGALEGFPLENVLPMLGRDEVLHRLQVATERSE